MEPQMRLQYLLRAGTEPADQAPQAAEAREAQCTGGAGRAEHAHGPCNSWQTGWVMVANSGC